MTKSKPTNFEGQERIEPILRIPPNNDVGITLIKINGFKVRVLHERSFFFFKTKSFKTAYYLDLEFVVNPKKIYTLDYFKIPKTGSGLDSAIEEAITAGLTKIKGRQKLKQFKQSMLKQK